MPVAAAFVGVIPAAFGAPTSGAPYLLASLQEHGPRHVERVLRLAAWVLDEATFEKLSARDVATLVVAVIARERILQEPLLALQQMLRRAALPPGALADDGPRRPTPQGAQPLDPGLQQLAIACTSSRVVPALRRMHSLPKVVGQSDKPSGSRTMVTGSSRALDR